MSEIINWLRRPKKAAGVYLVWDFGTNLNSLQEVWKEVKDPTNYDKVKDFFDTCSTNQSVVNLNEDVTIENLQEAAKANYEQTSAEYKPYNWLRDVYYPGHDLLLLVDSDTDVRCLIMIDPPSELLAQDMDSIITRLNWKRKDTNS